MRVRNRPELRRLKQLGPSQPSSKTFKLLPFLYWLQWTTISRNFSWFKELGTSQPPSKTFKLVSFHYDFNEHECLVAFYGIFHEIHSKLQKRTFNLGSRVISVDITVFHGTDSFLGHVYPTSNVDWNFSVHFRLGWRFEFDIISDNRRWITEIDFT